jgi:hypothetical protein
VIVQKEPAAYAYSEHSFVTWSRRSRPEDADTEAPVVLSTRVVGAVSMPQPAVVADAVEAARQDVEQKAPEEFRRLERHRLRHLRGIGTVVCHEGNYSVRNILSAERAAEKAKASGATSSSRLSSRSRHRIRFKAAR